MTRESLVTQDWEGIIARLGGAMTLERSARDTKAVLRARAIASAVDLLRLILAYCLSDRGLRSTAAWATAMGLADISNVALLQRLRQCGDWLAHLVGEALAAAAPQASRGRLIRIIAATTVPKAGTAAKRGNKLWRIHSAFDLPAERFGHFELTDQHGGETLDRIPVVKGEIRIPDRAYLQPDRIANVLEQGADIVVRAGWRNARWLDVDGEPVDLLAELGKASDHGLIDRPIFIGRKSGKPLALRLIAVKKSGQVAEAARRAARRQAKKQGHQVSKGTLAAAEWVILVTSLAPEAFSTADVLALYRLRWRIELGFKRLKSLIGLKGPPGADQRSAKPYVLAHLLIILLLEPLVDGLEDFPRWADGLAPAA
jgi:Transposase DDE domain